MSADARSVGAPEGTARAAGERPAYEALKRVLDVVLASVALLASLPVQAAVALAVRATSRGPVLFRQTRVGRGGRTFTMLKFRTMRADADDRVHREYVTRLLQDDNPPAGGAGGLYKLEGDRRVTRVGRVLRRTSLDELPQLWNVLRGDMSLVGPRPALPFEVELYAPEHRARLEVNPGITGLWQVSGRSALTMREALDLDVEYVRNRSLRLDLVILAQTVPAVLSVRRAG